MIFKRFVLYFDTCEVLLKRHVKRVFFFFGFVLLCLCACVSVCVRVFIPHCANGKEKKKKKNEPWRLSFRFDHSDETCGEGRPEGFSVQAVGVLQIVKSSISPCITLWRFLTSDRRAKDMIFYARQLYLTQTVPSKQQHDCVLSYLLVCRGHVIFLCVWAHVCVLMFSPGYLQGKKRNSLTHHPPPRYLN